jgi:hypothetical protein
VSHHLPDSRLASSIGEFLGREIAMCTNCRKGTLDFDTDLNGNVVETCAKCHLSRPMTGAKPRAVEETVERESLVVLVGDCSCGKPIMWRGMGSKPTRCPDCALERNREQIKEWALKNRSKRDVA